MQAVMNYNVSQLNTAGFFQHDCLNSCCLYYHIVDNDDLGSRESIFFGTNLRFVYVLYLALVLAGTRSTTVSVRLRRDGKE